MGRVRGRSEFSISLFPFLSVLICAMGVLIFVITAQNILAFGAADFLIDLVGTESEMEPVYVDCTRDGIVILPDQMEVPLEMLQRNIDSPFTALLDELELSQRILWGVPQTVRVVSGGLSVVLDLQNDLDKGILPTEFRQKFEEYGIPLSQSASVSVEQAGSRWIVADKLKEYSIWKHEGWFHVCQELLFSARLDLQNDLDRGILPKELRQTFEENGISLSQYISVSVKQTGNRWLIVDNSGKYPVRKKEHSLNIYASKKYLALLIRPEGIESYNRAMSLATEVWTSIPVGKDALLPGSGKVLLRSGNGNARMTGKDTE